MVGGLSPVEAVAIVTYGVTFGCHAFIAAGAVVTKDVPDYALFLGNPGRQTGWMSRHGHILKHPDNDGIMTCPESGYRYQLRTLSSDLCSPNSTVCCLDADENASLPVELAKGTQAYDNFKHSV